MNKSDAVWLWEQFQKSTNLGPKSANTFSMLVALYEEKPRAYHTMDHVLWGIRRVHEICDAEQAVWDKDNIIAAMFFHDSCMNFNGFSFLDEEASASLAVECEMPAGVVSMIMDTTHTHRPLSQSSRILLDADLSILGSDRLDFRSYEKLIRQEWAHVPVEDFRKARTKVLQRFLDMPQIFHTEYGRKMWETRARENLLWSIETTNDHYDILE